MNSIKTLKKQKQYCNKFNKDLKKKEKEMKSIEMRKEETKNAFICRWHNCPHRKS